MLPALYLLGLMLTVRRPAHPQRQVYCHVVLHEHGASEDCQKTA